MLLWDMLPNNAVLEFFPGRQTHGLLGSLIIFLSNVVIFCISLYILQAPPRWAAQGDRYVVKSVALNIAAFVLVNLFMLVSIIIMVIVGSLISQMTGNSNLYDLKIVGTCDFGYRR
jgi:hypothetical protein